MKLLIVCIRDSAACAFGRPFCAVSPGQAIRSFSDEVNNSSRENNEFNRHPEDFELYECGEYDDQTGTFDCHEPRSIARALDLKV